MARFRASTVFNLVVLAIGAVAFAFVVAHLGWSGIRQAVLGTGAWFVLIAAIDLTSAICDAFAIHGFLRPKARVPYWRVYAAQLSGMAINRLTPGNTLGEPVKVTMLVRSVPVDTAVSAIVMFNLTTLYVGIAAIVIGVPLTALLLDLPDQVALAVWIGLAVLVAFALALAIVVRRGAIGTLIDALVGLRIISAQRGTAWRTRIAAIDARVRSIGDARSSGLARGLAGVLGSRVINWLGTIVVLHAADIPLTAPLVVASLSVGILVTWMSNIIPLGLGIADGTNYVLYDILGAAPVAGLLFTLVNRLRTVVLALLGLIVMTIANAVHRRQTDPRMARTFAMGDPQAPFSKIRDVLDCHGALAGDRIAPDVVLVSIGDHFDYDLHNPGVASREGLELLRWLASHDAEQVVLLLGNHDASRVMEMALLSDEEFETARTLARSIDETERSAGDAAAKQRTRTEYIPAFPELPPPGVLGRDYASFTTEQRALVQQLLLAGRFQLARTAELADGRTAVLTHAGVTTRELGLLGCDDRDPHAIAAALNAHLTAAVDAVRADWERGISTPLSLEPLHVTGGRGEEGGGLLYHRPSNPDHGARDKAWSLAATRPRRFDPRTLPAGITQVAGHSGHAKCVHELGPWVAESAKARKHGGIRTLRVAGERVIYDMGIAPPAPGVADLILIDGELRRVPASEVALLPLARLIG